MGEDNLIDEANRRFGACMKVWACVIFKQDSPDKVTLTAFNKDCITISLQYVNKPAETKTIPSSLLGTTSTLSDENLIPTLSSFNNKVFENYTPVSPPITLFVFAFYVACLFASFDSIRDLFFLPADEPSVVTIIREVLGKRISQFAKPKASYVFFAMKALGIKSAKALGKFGFLTMLFGWVITSQISELKKQHNFNIQVKKNI
eukprot:snap_masked-scaffold_13-processed-gene-7.11-mRNA-1 protein AED:1.00 eAED:1.00 QI:0/0/0/0/1/1/2/0/203